MFSELCFPHHRLKNAIQKRNPKRTPIKKNFGFAKYTIAILNHSSEILNTKSHLSTTISRAIFLGVWLCQRR
jgi:hypothetical protein